MNGKNQNLLSCVGAMKIARNVAVSERHIEWCSPPPAPSLRELLSAAKLRECTPMNVTAQKLQSFRRGDESRPHPHGFASTPMNGKALARIKPKKSPAR